MIKRRDRIKPEPKYTGIILYFKFRVTSPCIDALNIFFSDQILTSLNQKNGTKKQIYTSLNLT